MKFIECVDITGNSCKKYDGFKKYISTGAVDVDYIDQNQIEIVTYDSKPSRANLITDDKSILFAKMQGTNKVLLINQELAVNIYSTGFFSVAPKKGILNKKCLYHLLKSKTFLYQKDKYCSGATQKAITLEGLNKIEINVPDIEEQNQIAHKLDSIKSLLKAYKKELENYEKIVKARFIEMFGSIHDGKFDMKTLLEFVRDDKNSIKRGPFGGSLKKDDFVDEGYLVYEQRHAIHNDFEYAKYYITKEKYENMIGFKVIPGDLIISCSGVTLGRIAEVPEDAKEGIINQALLKLSLNQNIMMNTFFIQQFRGQEIQEILFGFSRGSGIPNMPSMSELKSVKFICPPLELQKQYCDFVKQVDKSKLAVHKSLKKTQQLFDSLTQKYFG